MAAKERSTYVAHESDDAKRLSHDDYIRFAEELTARIVGANGPDTLADHAKRGDGEYATDYDGLGGTARLSEAVPSNPDLVYRTRSHFVVSEAKSTLGECTRKGFVSQVYDLLRLAFASDARRRYVILSVPFSALGEAKHAAVRAMRQLHRAQELGAEQDAILAKLLESRNEGAIDGNCSVCGVGSVALSFDPLKLGDGEVCVTYCSEIDGKAVPDPYGHIQADEDSRFEDTGYRSNSYEDLGDTRYPIMRTTLSIHDDHLLFDTLNNRLLGSDRTELGQGVCYERLLADGDVDSRNRSDAHQRRRDILNGLSIHQPVDVFMDARGSLHVIDGNSRLAEARYIASHAAEGSALGFLRVKANIFSAETGITREQIDTIKNSRQHEVKVAHDKIQDAFVIYDKVTNSHWDVARVRAYFGGIYSDAIIDGSVETIKRLKAIPDLDDDAIKDLYDPMWYLSNAGLKKMGAKGYAVSNEDWRNIARRLMEERGRIDSGTVELSKSYLSGSRFAVTVPVIMKATRKSDARKSLVDRWIKGDESLSSPDAFVLELKAISKQRSVREQQMEYLKRIERDVDTVTAFLSTIVYEDDDSIKEAVGLSQRDMRAMNSAITELMTKTNILRALNKQLGTHV